MSSATRNAALAVFVLALWACETDTADPGETTPPTVTGNTPAQGAVDVPVATSVTVTFSEAIDAATVTTSSFTLTGPGGVVSGAASLSGNTATFTPTAALAGNASYTARVTTGVRDHAGNALAAAHQWSFTTIETTPPSVDAVSPAAEAADVPLDATVTVTFSEAVDPATVTAATFSVASPVGPIAGTIAVNDDEVTFTPAELLTEFTTEYTVTLTTGIRDLKGNALASDVASTFRTILVHPGFWYRFSNLALGDDFSLGTFSNDPNRCFMPGTSPNLTGQRWRFTATGTGRFLLSNHFRGSSHLLEGGDGVNSCLLGLGFFTGQNWTLVPVADGGIYRLQNEFLGSARSLGTDPGDDVPYMAVTADDDGQHWRVRRIMPIETTPPTILGTSPVDDSTNVGIASAIVIAFSEPMDRGTLTTATVTVTGPEGAVAGTLSFNGTVGDTAIFTPTEPLTEFTTSYTAVVTAGALDRSGNALAADHTWDFTTVFVDPGFWYRLSNQHLGDGRSLDTFSDGANLCFMGTTSTPTGQFWALTQEPSELYRLNNLFGGTSLSLEGGNGVNACELEPSGNFSGQLWTITAVPNEEGYYRFQNLNFGTARSLDTEVGTDKPFMGVTGDVPGQYWKIRRTGPM